MMVEMRDEEGENGGMKDEMSGWREEGEREREGRRGETQG